uniref:Spike protein n=1 Tax=Turkey enteric coronavirus TaxID=11152 RepID=A0A893CDP0_CVTKE|nr:spike protein [Turkey coronavirus]
MQEMFLCLAIVLSLLSCISGVPLICANATVGSGECIPCNAIPEYSNGQNGGDALDFYSPNVMRPQDGAYIQKGYYEPIFSGCFNQTDFQNICSVQLGKPGNVSIDGVFLQNFDALGIMFWWGIQTNVGSTSPPIFNLTLGNFFLDSKNFTGFSKVKSVIFINNGEIYANGVLMGVYNLNFTEQLTIWLAQCVGTMKIVILRESNALVQFSAGNVVDFEPCTGDTIINKLRCSYQQFNFSTGFYDIDTFVPVSSNLTYLPYPDLRDNTGQSVFDFDVALKGDPVSYNQSCVDHKYTFFKLKCNNSYSWDVHKLCILGTEIYVPGYHVYTTTQHSYAGTIPHYTTCSSKGLSLQNIYNGIGFNRFCVTKLHETRDIASITQYTCVYVVSVEGFDSYHNGLIYRYVGIDFDFGTAMYSVQSPPTQSIYTEQCHNYNIYNIRGVGQILNVTGKDNTTLRDGGLAITSGSGLLAFRNNGSLYSVQPCQTVSTQAVIVNKTLVGVFVPVSCSLVTDFKLGNHTEYVDGGCLITNSTSSSRKRRSTGSTYVGECLGIFASMGSSCIYSNGSVHNRTLPQPSVQTNVQPLLGVLANVSIPKELTLAVTTEYLQTRYSKVTIDCAKYVCGDSIRCRTLLQQYGAFCQSINGILSGVNDNEDNGLLQFAEAINTGYTLNFTGYNTSNLNGFNLDLVLPKNLSVSGSQGRSTIEDLLFNKVVTLGVSEIDQNYDKCIASRGGSFTNLADLTCAQFYNGVMVLPGVVDPGLMAAYTGSLLGGMAFGGISAAAAIPFATQIQSRVNYLALTQSVLLDNQNLIARSFNNALKGIQSALDTVSKGFGEVAKGFESVAISLNKVQDVVNTHSDILNKLMAQLSVNFGAVSSSLSEIYLKLDQLNADAQVDRLITGRLTALSTYVASLQLAAYKADQSRRLALQKVEECVKSQSMRYGFCGNGSHVLTIPQNAPNGMFLIHYTYQPVTFVTVEAVPGLCVNTSTGQYGIMPRTGSGIIFRQNGTFYVTSTQLYEPKLLSYSEVVNLTSCQANYYNVSENETPFQPALPDFDLEFNGIYTELNISKDAINNITIKFNYSIPILNLEDDICALNQSINALYNYSSVIDEINQALNDTYINLEQLNKVTRYIKWPWYVWLAIGFACVIFILILGWVFFMTGCCGCCCGCFGIIPLISKCGKKASYYTTFDNDVVTEQYKPKKSV